MDFASIACESGKHMNDYVALLYQPYMIQLLSTKILIDQTLDSINHFPMYIVLKSENTLRRTCELYFLYKRSRHRHNPHIRSVEHLYIQPIVSFS